jgi:hypothetical protein
MFAELNISRIIELTRTVDALLLTWELKPSLNKVIAAQVRSRAGTISATTDSGSSLDRAKRDLDNIITNILQNHLGRPAN